MTVLVSNARYFHEDLHCSDISMYCCGDADCIVCGHLINDSIHWIWIGDSWLMILLLMLMCCCIWYICHRIDFWILVSVVLFEYDCDGGSYDMMLLSLF